MNTEPMLDTDPYAIFDAAGPIDPVFMADAVQALMRACPLDPKQSHGAQQRHLESALVALAATNPRDPIEVMLAVQGIAAYQAACACWHIGMNKPDEGRGRLQYMAGAASAARTFDNMLRAIERRQGKPLAAPAGRPGPKVWTPDAARDALAEMAGRVRRIDAEPPPEPPPPEADIVWTPEALAMVDEIIEQDRIDRENHGLDIANTEGILPGGGMILPEHPTPQQEAYMGRRLALMYKREIEENRRKGITKYPRIRGIRPGDLIP